MTLDRKWTPGAKAARAASCGKTMAFLNLRSFQDFFRHASHSHVCAPQKQRLGVTVDFAATLCITDMRSGAKYLQHIYIDPTDRVFNYIVQEMSTNFLGSVYFEILIWDDGGALVKVNYDRICGGRWLGIIDPASIPFLELKMPKTASEFGLFSLAQRQLAEAWEQSA